VLRSACPSDEEASDRGVVELGGELVVVAVVAEGGVVENAVHIDLDAGDGI
jgi:hypothetical protein